MKEEYENEKSASADLKPEAKQAAMLFSVAAAYKNASGDLLQTAVVVCALVCDKPAKWPLRLAARH
jgi:hypothetical protein